MTRSGATAQQTPEIELLQRAISYASGIVQTIAPQLLSRPTPCGRWDLRMLLRHANESLAALQEGIDTGRVGISPALDGGDAAADPARTFCDRAARLLGAWTTPSRHHRVITIAGCPLAAGLMAGAGALEIAVHGWDISQACGRRQPIPRALAIDLLTISPLLVAEADRHPLFAAPVTVAPTAHPSDRLVAYLGRNPQT